jgi:hypothetical protein
VKSAIEGTFSSAILATNLPTPAAGQAQHIRYALAVPNGDGRQEEDDDD